MTTSKQTVSNPLEQLLTSGVPLKTIQGVNDDVMETIYATAFNLYQGKNITKATKLFQFLCVYDHLEFKYFLGLAACMQAKKSYVEACQLYSYAALLELEDPRPPYHGGICYLAQGDFEKAESGFLAAVQWAEKSGHYPKILADASNKLSLVREMIARKKQA